jgi:pyruvate/2-oxoglutarate dehydrogenase complex dihydrolipoamide acyltransferase (E2) component
MAQRVIMPSLGLTMDEGTILEWLKQEGDAVAKDDPLLVVETDKAALEVPSPFAGVLVSISAAVGEIVAVGGTIAYVGEAGEVVEAARPPGTADVPSVPGGPQPQQLCAREPGSDGTYAVPGGDSPA